MSTAGDPVGIFTPLGVRAVGGRLHWSVPACCRLLLLLWWLAAAWGLLRVHILAVGLAAVSHGSQAVRLVWQFHQLALLRSTACWCAWALR